MRRRLDHLRRHRHLQSLLVPAAEFQRLSRRLGVWPDGYYVTFNMFNGNIVRRRPRLRLRPREDAGRSRGDPVCFQLGTTLTAACCRPISTAPRLRRQARPTSSWPSETTARRSTSGSSTSTLQRPPIPPSLTPTFAVAAFTAACSGGGTCIPQSGTTQQLDSLADRLMYRLAYRNFGDHESLVVNHSVTAGSSVGVRWYEIRSPDGTPTVVFSGHLRPGLELPLDGQHRDGQGRQHRPRLQRLQLRSMHPRIRYTGRASNRSTGHDCREKTRS